MRSPLWVGLAVAAAVLLWPSRPSPSASTRRRRVVPVGGRRRSGPAALPADELAVVADLLALVLRSGIGIAEGIALLAEELDGQAGEALATVSAGYAWGLPDESVWRAVPGSWGPIARALRLSREAGSAPAAALATVAEDLRLGERHRLELAAARLGVTIVLPLGLAYLPAFLLTTVIPVVIALTGEVLTP